MHRAPTYRIVDVETGEELRPYQTSAHVAVYIVDEQVQVVSRNVDSISLNLHTVYVTRTIIAN